SSDEWGADATVTVRHDGTVVATHRLDRRNDGTYGVGGLRPDTYTVTVTHEDIYTPTTTTTRTRTLTSGQVASANFGLYRKPVSVTGVVFHDRNGNGAKDP